MQANTNPDAGRELIILAEGAAIARLLGRRLCESTPTAEGHTYHVPVSPEEDARILAWQDEVREGFEWLEAAE